MTLTSWDFALAAIAAPEPESRFTSRSTFAPLVIACSACCCCVDLSPSAFWIVASTPAASKASFRNGRSTVSQRTDDLESGSSTATLPASSPPPPPPPEPEPESSSPQPATASAQPAATVATNHAPLRMGFLLLIGFVSSSLRSPRLHHRAKWVVALGLGEDERDGAEHLGAVAERAGDDVWPPATAVGSADRSSDSRTPSSSSSPASERSPPTISSSGLSTFTSVAAALPIARPASAITRRQPRSPSRARRTIARPSRPSPWLRRSSSASASVPATVSRQPRLPQRQTGPSASTSTWPSSPARPSAPRYRRPLSTSPAPMPDEIIR